MVQETGDPKIFHGIAQDSIVMNLDDLAERDMGSDCSFQHGES